MKTKIFRIKLRQSTEVVFRVEAASKREAEIKAINQIYCRPDLVVVRSAEDKDQKTAPDIGGVHLAVGPLPRMHGRNGKCDCGKPGKFIADGICRYGFYCKKCSTKAIEKG